MTPRLRPWPLFLTFVAITLSGFGGALPFARRMLVERRNWLTAEEFTETLSLCQSLPGPNIVNLSIVVGSRACGWRGAVSAGFGLVGPPVVLVTVLGVLYGRFGALGEVRDALTGLGACACGLVAATAARMAEPLLKSRLALAAPFMFAAFCGVALLHWPLPDMLLGLAPASIAAAWFRRRRS
ncbi:MAG TPA: chromate transporter [Caulobacteraceae bacterium]|nr:chromate transporter [Caulobacteraceae bacterium]